MGRNLVLVAIYIFGFIYYIIQSWALCEMAIQEGQPPMLALVPIAQDYLLGDISNIRALKIILPVLACAYIATSNMVIVLLLYMAAHTWACYGIYDSRIPERKIIYTVLSIFVPIAVPFFLLHAAKAGE